MMPVCSSSNNVAWHQVEQQVCSAGGECIRFHFKEKKSPLLLTMHVQDHITLHAHMLTSTLKCSPLLPTLNTHLLQGLLLCSWSSGLRSWWSRRPRSWAPVGYAGQPQLRTQEHAHLHKSIAEQLQIFKIPKRSRAPTCA